MPCVKMVYVVVLCFSLGIFATSVSAAIDLRQCYEKLEGPLGTTSHILPLQANASNNFTFPVHCRTICQEDGATYTPSLRILVMEEGQAYESEREWAQALHLFRVTQPSSIASTGVACNASSSTTDYEYQVRVVSPRFNRSVVQCRLHYTAMDDPHRPYSEICYSDIVAWITVHDWPQVSPTTVVTSTVPSTSIESSFNTMLTRSISSNSFSTVSTVGRSSTASSVLPTTKTTFGLSTSVQPSSTPSPQPPSECSTCPCEPDVDTGSRIDIPGEASVGIIVAISTVSLVVIGVLLLLTIIFYKRGTGEHQMNRIAPELNRGSENVLDISISSRGSVRVSRDHQPEGPDALVMQNFQVDRSTNPVQS